MFGFIRPLKSELRVREADRFQCVYCGLCHTLRQQYGRLQTFFLSYDMTFLALLFEGLLPEGAETTKKRCDASPVRRRQVLCEDSALRYAADMSVLLMYHRFNDTVADEHGLKRTVGKILRSLSKSSYRRACQAHPNIDKAMRECLYELTEIEKLRTPSIDKAADPFARLLSACVPSKEDTVGRILRELFYHIGRWIYLIDACQDLQDDWKSGSYNPIILRFALTQPDLVPIREQLEITLARSLAAARAAFELLAIQRDRELLENIICLGLPMVTRQVLDGTYQSNGGQSRHGSL